jgi:hypothetical protein
MSVNPINYTNIYMSNLGVQGRRTQSDSSHATSTSISGRSRPCRSSALYRSGERSPYVPMSRSCLATSCTWRAFEPRPHTTPRHSDPSSLCPVEILLGQPRCYDAPKMAKKEARKGWGGGKAKAAPPSLEPLILYRFILR